MADLEDLKEAAPYLRTAVAFILFLRFASPGAPVQLVSFEFCYELADLFLARLEADLERTK